MDFEDGRQFLLGRLSACRGKDGPDVHAVAVGGLHPMGLGNANPPLGQQRAVEVRKLPKSAPGGPAVQDGHFRQLRGSAHGGGQAAAIGRDIAQSHVQRAAGEVLDWAAADGNRRHVTLASLAKPQVEATAVGTEDQRGKSLVQGRVAHALRLKANIMLARHAAAAAARRVADEQLQVLVAVDGLLAQSACKGDRLPIGRPADGRFRARRQTANRRCPAACRVDPQKFVLPGRQVRFHGAVRAHDQVPGIGREVEAELARGVLAVNFPRPARFRVDQVQAAALGGGKALAVQPVEKFLHDLRRIAQTGRDALLASRFRPLRIAWPETDCQDHPVGRPGEAANGPFRKLGKAAGLAAIGPNQVKVAVPVGCVADEGQLPAVRRPAGLAILVALGQLPRLLPAVASGLRAGFFLGDRHHPEVACIVVPRADVPLHENHAIAVRGNLRTAEDAEKLEIFGHDGPPAATDTGEVAVHVLASLACHVYLWLACRAEMREVAR